VIVAKNPNQKSTTITNNTPSELSVNLVFKTNKSQFSEDYTVPAKETRNFPMLDFGYIKVSINVEYDKDISIIPEGIISKNIYNIEEGEGLTITIQPNESGVFQTNCWQIEKVGPLEEIGKCELSIQSSNEAVRVVLFKVVRRASDMTGPFGSFICESLDIEPSLNNFRLENNSTYLVSMVNQYSNVKYYVLSVGDTNANYVLTYHGSFGFKENVDVEFARSKEPQKSFEYYGGGSLIRIYNPDEIEIFPPAKIYDITDNKAVMLLPFVGKRTYILSRHVNYSITNNIVGEYTLNQSIGNVRKHHFIERFKSNDGKTIIRYDPYQFDHVKLMIKMDDYVEVENNYSVSEDTEYIDFMLIDMIEDNIQYFPELLKLDSGYTYTLKKMGEVTEKNLHYENNYLCFQLNNQEYISGIESVTMDTTPIIKDNRTLLPARYVIEPLGGSVSWDGAERKVTCILKAPSNSTGDDSVDESKYNTVELWIGKPTTRVNVVEKQIDSNDPGVVPTVVDGRTMVPMRFLAENLGCEVEWIAETKEIILTYSP